MVSFFKSFGKGILYIILLPFALVFLAFMMIVGLLIFIYQSIVIIIRFITGRQIFDELPEDREARIIKEAKFASATQPVSQPTNPQPQTITNPDTITINIPISSLQRKEETRAPIDIIEEENAQIGSANYQEIEATNEEPNNPTNGSSYDSFDVGDNGENQ